MPHHYKLPAFLPVSALVSLAFGFCFVTAEGRAQVCKTVTSLSGLKCAQPGAACDPGDGSKGRCITLNDGECDCHGNGAVPTYRGVYYPKYYILTLLYAPPGCTSTPTVKCQSSPGLISLADYSTGSSTGTATSTTSSFKQGVSISANSGLAFLGIDLFSADVNFGFSSTSTQGSSETISKSQTSEIKVPGNGDGVDHSQDTFLLLVNPAVGVSVQGTSVQTNIGYYGPSALWYRLPVQWLQDPSQMKSDVASQLKALGFTTTDYATILAQDPFANGSTAIDGNRYARTTLTFPYEPPQQESDCNSGVCTCAVLSQVIKNELVNQTSSSYQSDYTVGFSVSASAPVPVIGDLGMKDSTSFTWTNTSSTVNTTDSSQSATVAVACPSTAYDGPTFMAVYWDKLYGSFLFVPLVVGPGSSVVSQGSVTNASGVRLRHQEVSLSYSGKVYRTFTDNKGNFHFYSSGIQTELGKEAVGQLAVKNVAVSVTLGSPTPTEIRTK